MNKNNFVQRFCGSDIGDEYSRPENSMAVILPCPYEGTVSYGHGTKNAPQAILSASDHLELFDDELKKETFKMGINTRDALNFREGSPEAAVDMVREEVSGIFDSKKIPVIIGGEHTVSVGAIRAAKDKYHDLSILHFDAHYDLRDTYNNSNYSHACAARRFLEHCPVVQAGVRSLSFEEQKFIESTPVSKLYSVNMHTIREDKNWQRTAIDKLSDEVYLSIDMDVFDPSIIPSVGTPEPGGMDWYEATGFIKNVAASKKIVGFDVVELMPISGVVHPDFFAAKLIYRILGYIEDTLKA